MERPQAAPQPRVGRAAGAGSCAFVCAVRQRKYAGARDALIALWEASDRLCGKRLVAMIPALLPALERHGRLQPTSEERRLLLSVSAATIDRMLVDVKVAAAGGRRRRVGFYSAIRREVPIRTFNDWGSPPPGFCEIDMVAHGGTSVSGSFIQTLTMVDIATGWTECLPLVAREIPLGGSVYRHFSRPESSSASRFTAGAAGFLLLNQWRERPDR
jgi:hypothetical protein